MAGTKRSAGIVDRTAAKKLKTQHKVKAVPRTRTVTLDSTSSQASEAESDDDLDVADADSDSVTSSEDEAVTPQIQSVHQDFPKKASGAETFLNGKIHLPYELAPSNLTCLIPNT